MAELDGLVAAHLSSAPQANERPYWILDRDLIFAGSINPDARPRLLSVNNASQLLADVIYPFDHFAASSLRSNSQLRPE